MDMLNLHANPPSINVLLFLVGAAGVWLSGTKLSHYVDLIADRTGIGKAFAGALLLGGATSLPEIATTITASLSGAATLAATNLFGGVVMQIAVLAGIDAVLLRGKPLTLFSPKPALLMQGVMLITIIAIALAGLSTGELAAVGQVGVWPMLLAVVYVAGMWSIYRYEGSARWEPTGQVMQPPESAIDMKDAHHAKYEGVRSRAILWRFAAAALGVLIAGFVVARTGDVLASQTGLGQSFVGATMLALATSLPEVSTTWSAVRLGAYSMATANILGTNILEIALFLPADMAYRESPIFDVLDPTVGLLGALGIVVTCVYLWGILERKDWTFLGMGVDSAVVLLVYASGMLLFYYL